MFAPPSLRFAPTSFNPEPYGSKKNSTSKKSFLQVLWEGGRVKRFFWAVEFLGKRF
jgi:hypothetical protein